MNGRDDLYFMRCALVEAEKAFFYNEVPVGAVVVCDGKIVGSGFNCKEREFNSLKHAELIAINEACGKLKSWRLDDCIIYSTLEPCLMCYGAIYESRIKKVVYAVPNKSEQLFDKNNFNISGGIMYDESLELIQKFFKKMRQ